MTVYKAPLQELQFILDHLVNYTELCEMPIFEDASEDMVAAILPEAARFFEQVVAPTNWPSNTQPAFLDGDKVAVFDYVIDCGGYPDDYSDYNICKHISLNSCLVHNTKPQKFNYTHHKATPNGWMF